MARKVRIDMIGVRYGRLVGISYAHSEGGHAHWLFSCDCGSEVITNGAAVRAGTTASCGCLHREVSAARLTVHGRRAAKRHDATYRAWQAMNDACSNPASPKFRDCGALGISVSPHWRNDFEAFAQNMGERPHAAMLARIDPARGFVLGNCRWVPVQTRSHRAAEGWRRARGLPTSADEPICPDTTRERILEDAR